MSHYFGGTQASGATFNSSFSLGACLPHPTLFYWTWIIDEPTTDRSTYVSPVLQFRPSVRSFLHRIHPSINHLYLSWLLATIIREKGREEHHPLGSHHPCAWLIVWGGCGYLGEHVWYACGFMSTEGVNEEAIATTSSSKSWTRHWNSNP